MQRLLLLKASNDFPALTFPLGLMYLSSIVKKNFPDVAVDLYDLRVRHNTMEGLEAKLREFQPTAVGIAFLSVEMDSAVEMARRVKRFNPDIPVIVGGPHPSSDAKGLLESTPEMDYAVVGEGEETFEAWYRAMLEGQRDLSAIDGLWWRSDDGVPIGNAPRANIKDVDAIPWPDYELVEMEDYWREWSMGDTSYRRYHTYVNLFTSRACPYKCTYCHELFGKGFRARSPESVVDEMQALQARYGADEFEILDDIFNFNAERTKAICRLMVERGVKAKMSFPNGLRTDRLDKELIGLLKASGTKFIAIAVETVTPRLQKQIKKNLKVDYVFEMIEECHRQGIFTRGYFMIGFPSETREEIQATIDYAVRSKLTTANFFIVVPYKGTAIEQENKELVESMNIEYGKIDYWTNHYNMSAVSNRQLKNLQRKAILSFYLSPRRFFYIWRAAPSPWRFLANGMTTSMVLFWRVLSVDRPNWGKLWLKLKTQIGLGPATAGESAAA